VNDGSITAYLINNADSLQDAKKIGTVNLLLSVVVLFTYPLQMFPCHSLILRLMKRYTPKEYVMIEDEDEEEGEEGFHVSQDDGINIGSSSKSSNRTANDNYNDDSNINPFEKEDDDDEDDDYGEDEEKQRGSITINRENEQDPPMIVRFRVMLVMITFLLALIIPNVATLISFSGSITGTAVAILLPPILYGRICGSSSHDTLLRAIICIGLVLGISGSVASFFNLIS
jgi:hypothetical protein